MNYSQNNEQNVVLEYFGNYVGTFLDLGSNDGKSLSNTYALSEMMGWSGTCVEPSPLAFAKLCGLYLHNDKIYCLKVAVSDYMGEADFYDSGTHLNQGDTGLLSTMSKKEKAKWEKYAEFKSIKTNVVNFPALLNLSPYKQFQFISMDCEGCELLVLPQMDFKSLDTKMLIVEWNSKDQHLYDEIILPFGFKLIYSNAENLLYAIL